MTEVYFEWSCGKTLVKKFNTLKDFENFLDNELDVNYWEGVFKYWSDNPEWIF